MYWMVTNVHSKIFTAKMRTKISAKMRVICHLKKEINKLYDNYNNLKKEAVEEGKKQGVKEKMKGATK